MLVILRDGRKLHGVLRSYDQFGAYHDLALFRVRRVLILAVHAANLVLEETVERIYFENSFADKYVGLFLIRGENVVLLGEIVRSFSILPYPGAERIGFGCLHRTWTKRTRFHCRE